jgi:hypothetical protein
MKTPLRADTAQFFAFSSWSRFTMTNFFLSFGTKAKAFLGCLFDRKIEVAPELGSPGFDAP